MGFLCVNVTLHLIKQNSVLNAIDSNSVLLYLCAAGHHAIDL